MTSKVISEIRRTMARDKWYNSKEHFRTEKSYEQHKRDLKRKKKRTNPWTPIPIHRFKF